MIQNTLYNSGGYIKRSKFFIVLWASFYCIPDIIKVSARHIFGRKNTSASMLRIYKNKSIPLRALVLNKYIISVSFYDVRFPIEYQHSIWSNVLWLRRVKKLNIVVLKKIYIYIYINSTLVSTIHTHFKKMLKNIFIKKYMWQTKNNIVCLPDYYHNLCILI